MSPEIKSYLKELEDWQRQIIELNIKHAKAADPRIKELYKLGGVSMKADKLIGAFRVNDERVSFIFYDGEHLLDTDGVLLDEADDSERIIHWKTAGEVKESSMKNLYRQAADQFIDYFEEEELM